MTPVVDSLPVVGRAYRFGVNPVTTTLVLFGPVLLAGIAVFGRNPLTVAIGSAYVLAVPVSVAYFRLAGHVPADGDGEGKTADGERDPGGAGAADGEEAADPTETTGDEQQTDRDGAGDGE